MRLHKIAIIVAAILWGMMGFFSRNLSQLHMQTGGVIALRCGIGAICFAVLMLFTNRTYFKIKLKDIWCFIGSGIFSLLFFSFCYFQAINCMNLSAAAILLYTAPSIVIIISFFIFKEPLTKRKVCAMLIAFLGCALASGLTNGLRDFSLIGVCYGIGSGLGYALYSIFARIALNKGYHSNAINFYSCLLASISASFIWGIKEPITIMMEAPYNLILCIIMGVVTCFLPYFLYTFGLTKVEAGKASIMASVEVVAATLVGIIIFKEKLQFSALAGVILVLYAVNLLNHSSKKDTIF